MNGDGTDESGRCQCGRATGILCGWIGPRADTVLVEWMPHELRRSRARGDWGGAMRMRICVAHVDSLVQPGAWARVVAALPSG